MRNQEAKTISNKKERKKEKEEGERREMGKGTLEVLLVDAKGLADTDFLGKL